MLTFNLGTVNYIHLFPMYCVSIALVVGGEPVIGVINAPFLKQTFSACRGRGAWLNGTQRLPLLRQPVPPMPEHAPKGCVFSCEWGKDRRDDPDGNLRRKVDSFLNMATEIGGRDGKGGMVHGVRSLGSATLDLAYVAMGAFDIWWEGGCWFACPATCATSIRLTWSLQGNGMLPPASVSSKRRVDSSRPPTLLMIRPRIPLTKPSLVGDYTSPSARPAMVRPRPEDRDRSALLGRCGAGLKLLNTRDRVSERWSRTVSMPYIFNYMRVDWTDVAHHSRRCNMLTC